jgi:molecular chaperone GrpE
MKEEQKNPETEADAPAAEITLEQLAEFQSRADKAEKNWVQTAADFENFKKRAAREKTEATQFANVSLVQKLLPVLDNFEMAQAAAETSHAHKLASLQAGVAMVQQQLKSILAETGLEEIDANGKTFDPNLHEAVSQTETADAPEGTVVQQIRKGYKLRDRLLRPASVIVAKKPASETNAGKSN